MELHHDTREDWTIQESTMAWNSAREKTKQCQLTGSGELITQQVYQGV